MRLRSTRRLAIQPTPPSRVRSGERPRPDSAVPDVLSAPRLRSSPSHRTFGQALLQKLVELGPVFRVVDELFPALVAMVREEEARKVRHLDALGLGELLADLDEFSRVAAHERILRYGKDDSTRSYSSHAARRRLARVDRKSVV